MGLVRELFDEVISLPKAHEHNFDIKGNISSFHFRFFYAFLNLIFQVIDCLIIPYYTLLLYYSLLHGFGYLKMMLVVIGAFSSIFSIYQVLYWFIKPVENYVTLRDRIMGETAIGAFLSSVFKIEIYYHSK